jgi:hypothetical protein
MYLISAVKYRPHRPHSNNLAICRTFVRSVLTVIITRVGVSIARISQIATAD